MADSEALYLIKVPLRLDKVVAIARRRRMPTSELDEGYLVHAVLRGLWQEMAPAPFVVRGQSRCLDVWGYSSVPAEQLRDTAQAYGDPTLVEALDGIDGVAGREMPIFTQGQRVGFLLRTTPIVRLARSTHGHRAGAEVDAFLAKCFEVGPEVAVSREEVYRDWLQRRLTEDKTGARVEALAVAGIARERLTRWTQGERRQARRMERPDIRFEGDLVIRDGRRFRGFLAGGVGRHRAFGYGAVIVVPPGTKQGL